MTSDFQVACPHRRRTSLGGRCGECEIERPLRGCRARAYGMESCLKNSLDRVTVEEVELIRAGMPTPRCLVEVEPRWVAMKQREEAVAVNPCTRDARWDPDARPKACFYPVTVWLFPCILNRRRN
jgi:hypothetical protein